MKIIRSNNQEYEKKWIELQSKFPFSHFQSYVWCKYLVDSNLDSVFFVEGENYFFPFILKKWKGIRVLTLLGGDAADYMFPFCEMNFNFDDLILKLKDEFRFDVFEVKRCNDNYFLTFKKFKYFESSFQIIRKEGRFADIIKKKILADTQRQLKRLQEVGKIEFRIFETKEDVLFHFESFVKMKNDQHSKIQVPSILNDEFWQKFYLSGILEQNPTSSIKFQFSALCLNDYPISFHLGIYNQDRFMYLLPTYADEYNKYSPGRIHMFEMFNWCEKNGIHTFDFSVGAETYKNNFCNNEMPLYNYYKIVNIKGCLYYLVQKTRNYLNTFSKFRSFILKLKSQRVNNEKIAH